MRKHAVWKLTPALIGLCSLLVYILACTSFSPDDSKVLYTTVDGKTGATGAAVYDRKSGKSELLFQPLTEEAQNLAVKPALLRPQWLQDGHSFLTTWRIGMKDESDMTLNFAVLPFDKRSPARVFEVTDLKDDASMFYYWPVPVSGKFAFLVGPSNTLIRLDLVTGAMRAQTNQLSVIPLPAPDNDRLFYLTGVDNTNVLTECGLLDPESFARTPLFKIEDKGKLSPLSMALSRDAKKFAYQDDNGNPLEIHLLEAGQAARILSLASLGKKTVVNIRQFSPKGELLYAAYESTEETSGNTDYGLLEIPLDGSAIRKTVLLGGAPKGDKEMLASFQIDLSHDGKTVAVESLWLAYGESNFKAEDCALFLVDVSKPEHKITKVPIPLPPKEGPSPLEK